MKEEKYMKTNLSYSVHLIILISSMVLFSLPLNGLEPAHSQGSYIGIEKDTVKKLPNIICILADDLGYGDITCLNENSKIKTPNIDKLASEGMTFTDAHSSSAVCSPTRYALLTGRYNWRSRLKSNVLWYWDEPLIESDRLTVGDLLSKNGYSTACIGKWHLGWDWPTYDGRKINDQLTIGQYDKRRRDSFSKNIDFTRPIANGPVTRGFDYYFGDDVPGFPPFCFIENDRTIGLPSEEKPDSIFGYSDGGPMIKGWNWEELLPAITRKAVDYICAQDDQGSILRDRDKPFFLYFPLSAPHVPIAPTDEFKGTSQAGAYGDFVQQIDWTVGQIIGALEKMGLTENTLIIFTSDNGSPGRDGQNMVGDYNTVRKYGHNPSYIYRGTKTDIWEGGHRVPFIAKWPELVEAGTIRQETICLTDLMATCAAIVGETLPDNAGEDSYNLLPVLQGKDSRGQFREATVHHSNNGSFSIRQGEWKLIMCAGSGGLSRPRDKEAIENGLPAYQLYNLKKDPGEECNLYEEYTEKANELRQILFEYIENGRSTPGAKQKNDGFAPVFTRTIVVNNQAVNSSDNNTGTGALPLKTILAAANIAGPGDTILVRAGIYREEVIPPYGGESENMPVVYMAAPGEVVSIRGSEQVTGWKHQSDDIWMIELDTAFFKAYNPFAIEIDGAWLHRGWGHHLGDVYLDGEALTEELTIDELISNANTWYVDTGIMFNERRVFADGLIRIWANFGGADPNKNLTEINVRPTAIFPELSGLKFVVIDGFDIRHTAPQWGDIYKLEKGAIGTKYGYGWTIQNCRISYSRNIGISMGVTNENHFPKKNEGGLLEGGGNIPPMETLGHHLIRNNVIKRCGQAGIYGCYGAVGSIIEGNVISETNYRNEWFGSNQAGIKILFPIDVIIRDNHIFGVPGLRNGAKGIWLDWGSQNTRVTNNVICDFNFPGTDGLKLEVNFGPVIVDNNVFARSRIMEEGNGAVFVHNLFYNNSFFFRASTERVVPYFKPHSTIRAGKKGTSLLHERWFNNIFIGEGIDKALEMETDGSGIIVNNNVYLGGAVKFPDQDKVSVVDGSNTNAVFKNDEDYVTMSFNIPSTLFEGKYPFITSGFIGKVPFADMPMEHLDATPLNIISDFYGKQIDPNNVIPGPFQNITPGENNFILFPLKNG